MAGDVVDVLLLAWALLFVALAFRHLRVTRELEQSRLDLEARAAELRRSYEALQAAQGELVKREQLAVVGELAAVIAHEVRNPLAVISNAIAGLRRGELDPKDHAILLGIIDEENSRLNRLVSDLLCYARPVSPQRQPVEVGEFIERAVSLRLSGCASIRASFDCDGSLEPVLLDPSLMRQVLDNIVGNAVQAMDGDGALSIRIHGTSRDGLRGVLIEVQDTGDGMDTLVRSQARTPFFTTRPSGTGLGLAIVDRIIEAHGGSMALASRAGEGTTVSLFLPLGRESQPPTPSVILRAADRQKPS